MNSMKSRLSAVAVVACLAFFLPACSAQESNHMTHTSSESASGTDAAGLTKEQSYDLTAPERYAAAAQQYSKLNRVLTDVQNDIFRGPWQDSPTHSGVTPGEGYLSGMPLEGDGRGPDGQGDSYTFWVLRFLTPQEPLEQLQSTAATSWRERGWEIKEESVFGGKLYTAMTPEGYRIALNAESKDTLSVTVTSPVYWGNFSALLQDIAARRDAEDAKKAPGTQFERDPETKQATLRPGQFRPFPAWNALTSTP